MLEVRRWQFGGIYVSQESRALRYRSGRRLRTLQLRKKVPGKDPGDAARWIPAPVAASGSLLRPRPTATGSNNRALRALPVSVATCATISSQRSLHGLCLSPRMRYQKNQSPGTDVLQSRPQDPASCEGSLSSQHPQAWACVTSL